MDIFLWLPNSYPVLLFPSLLGMVAWFLLAGLLAWNIWSWRHFQPVWQGRAWGIFITLYLLQILFALTPGLRLSAEAGMLVPNSPQEFKGPALMLFSALPWMLAGGLLGPLAAALSGLSAGLLRFLWDSHSIFTPLEFALLASLFSIAVRQRYRTRPFRLLSQPLAASIVLAVLYVPVYVIDSFLAVADPANLSIADSLIYAASSAPGATTAIAFELLIGGIFAQVLAIAFPAWFGRRLPLLPSPTERSLEARFLFGTGALTILLLLSLLLGNWVVAGNSAREMLSKRMKGTAELAAQNVPFFMETGQNLAAQLSQIPQVETDSGETLSNALGEQIRAIPFFEQLLVFDQEKRIMGSYPAASGPPLNLYPEENTAIELALNGVLSQTYSIPPTSPEKPARLSFIVAVLDSTSGQPVRALIARTDLESNPFTQPMLNSLKSMEELNGEGILLDENGRILVHSAARQIMSRMQADCKLTPVSSTTPRAAGRATWSITSRLPDGRGR